MSEERKPRVALESGRWIAVTERLPTHVYSVIMWVVGPLNVLPCAPLREVGIYNSNRGKWQLGGYADDDIDVEVTHWMDLPEASWEPPVQFPRQRFN